MRLRAIDPVATIVLMLAVIVGLFSLEATRIRDQALSALDWQRAQVEWIEAGTRHMSSECRSELYSGVMIEAQRADRSGGI
jgi:hypothetical protein